MFKLSVSGPIQRWWGRLPNAKRRCAMVAAVGALFVAPAMAFMLQPPEIGDLSEENGHQLPRLLAQWKKGDVLVLLRHLERCDKEDSPCLVGSEGITARSVAIGHALADSYARLGLENTTILNSPLTRTAQTEAIVFADVGTDKTWLYECRNTMLRDALEHKVPGKNLVLVTHSSCIDAFEKALGYDTDKPGYGTSLFFATGANPGGLDVLGFVDADDWSSVLGVEQPRMASRGRIRSHGDRLL